MSVESLEAFGRKVQVDAEILEELLEARAVATVKVARAAGFSFSVEELRAAIKETAGELSDLQLEAVAGGLIDMPFAVKKNPLTQQ